MENPTGKMTFGNFSEVLSCCYCRCFSKNLASSILVGMLAWAVRYLLFAFGDAGELTFMLLIGIALPGFAMTFFVSGQIYTVISGRKSQKCSTRAHNTGHLWGGNVGWVLDCRKISDHYILANSLHDWSMIWLLYRFCPCGFSYLCLYLKAKTLN